MQIHIITCLDNGGAESVLYRLVSVSPKNHHVVSMMGLGKYGPILKEAGVAVTCLNMPSGRVNFRGLFRLYSLLKKEKPMVVQTWMYHADLLGGLVARIAGVKNVHWNIRHSELEPGKSKRSTIFVAKACAFLSRWIPLKIICCAEKAMQVHARYGYDKSKMVVINNGYNLSLFKPDSDARNRVRAELKLSDDTLLLGMVGRFNVQKNHKGLLDSLRQLKEQEVEFKCALVGAGMNQVNADLSTWIEKAGLVNDVLLLDQRSDIPAIMNAMDIHVFSSSFGEGFPNVLAEAMACGTPCVTTDVGDAALIVGETGWVVPVNDTDSFSNAVYMAVNEWSENFIAWESRKNSAIKRVEDNFSLAKMVDAYHRVWHSA